MSKIAVLIPTYKPGLYLERCLESLERQTLSKDKFKVYIALNGPKDNFEEVIHSALENTNFNYEFFYIEKAGVSNARNYLIDNSVEPFIAFVDDDDVLSEDYLSELLRVSSEDVVGISNVYNFIDNINIVNENYIGRSFGLLDDITGSKFRARKYFSSPWAKLIHRNIIGDVRFDTKLATGEDSLFMAKLSDRVRFIRKTPDGACYYVCQRDGSATRRKIDKFKEIRRILYLLKEYCAMFFSFRYENLFVLSRIVATLLHTRNLFK